VSNERSESAQAFYSFLRRDRHGQSVGAILSDTLFGRNLPHGDDPANGGDSMHGQRSSPSGRHGIWPRLHERSGRREQEDPKNFWSGTGQLWSTRLGWQPGLLRSEKRNYLRLRHESNGTRCFSERKIAQTFGVLL